MTSSAREHRRQLYERLVGQTIDGRFEITRLMGFGGMGAVYEAIQRNMNRRIALKFIPSHNPVTAARFEREALTVSQLRHPNTVTVFDYGQTEDGFLYLTMELLNGTTLTEAIKTQGPMSPERAVHIATQVCRSLSEAHRNGIVHRDIKPDNIFLIEVDGDPDVVKVLDFGIAKVVSGEDDVQLTGDGRIIGTPRYMSPEQILSESIDHRSDIYSLGCIIFEMLCGAPPFQQPSTTALMISHTQDAPPPFAERLSEEMLHRIPLGLEHVVRRALAKNPDDRPQTTDEFRDELEQALARRHAMLTGAHPALTGTGAHPALTGEGHRAALDRSMTMTGTAVAQPSEGRKPPAALIAIGALLVVIVGAALFAIFRPDAAGPSSDPARDAAPGLAAQADPAGTDGLEDGAADEDDAAPSVHVRINSEPAGATLYEGDEAIGITPVTLALAPGTRQVIYRLSLGGHEDRAIEVELDPNATRRQEFSFLLTPTAPVAADSGQEADDERARGDRRPAASSARNTRRSSSQPASTPRSNTASGTKTVEVSPAASAEAAAVEQAEVPRREPERPKIQRLDDEPARPRVDRL